MINVSDVLVLVLSTSHDSYDEFKLAQKQTWVKKFQDKGLHVYFYEGSKSENYIDNDTIGVTVPDELSHCSEKLSEALKLIIDKHPNIKLVYRSNLSSYIDLDLFLKKLGEIESYEDYYAGPLVTFNLLHAKYFNFYCKTNSIVRKIKNYNIRMAFTLINTFIESLLRHLCLKFLSKFNYVFASGSGFFLGSNHFNKVIKFNNKSYVDDVMVRLAVEKDIDENIPRFDFTKSYTSISKLNYENRDFFHYRFKTDSRRLDSVLLRAIDDPETRKKLIQKQELHNG